MALPLPVVALILSEVLPFVPTLKGNGLLHALADACQAYVKANQGEPKIIKE